MINIFVGETFERDDLFRLLYSNRLLEAAMMDGVVAVTSNNSKELALPK